MPRERFDYTSERQRHEPLIGRSALLDRLDRLLVDDFVDRCVLITGGPGMGKSALLAAWLARREAAGGWVPHHFIRRGEYDWDDPAKLVSSLVVQLEERFADLREPEHASRMHPAARLAALLSRVSAMLGPHGEQLVLLIDGLDEYDPPAALAGDPLAAFLPHVLPRGVCLLCASRPRPPYVSALEARAGELVHIDLDDPASAADNEATVRMFWLQAAGPLGLDARFVDAAVARASGNVQHAVTLHKQLRVLPADQRRAEDIPRGLAALLARTWERVACEAVVAEGLGILCAAREALTLDELGAVAGWTGETPRRTFMRGARELLIEVRRSDGQAELRVHHDTIRAYIAEALGPVALRAHHRAIAQRLAVWPVAAGAPVRRYVLRYALSHRAEGGDWADAWRLVADASFLEAQCRELGVHETEADVTRLAERCRGSGDAALGQRFADVARALSRESHWLRAAPEATAALLWNRLRRSGWSAEHIDGRLQLSSGSSFLRVRHAATRDSPALVRDLVGHLHDVTCCAVTEDGRRAVSGSADGSLRVWDLPSGCLLTTLQCHAAWVNGCAMTADGRLAVSASYDRTLKIWDLECQRELTTFTGHAGSIGACVLTADRRRIVSASRDRTLRIWDLETGRTLVTLAGHAGPVNGCSVTVDGRRVVSASADGTLRAWDTETGELLCTLADHAGPVNGCAMMGNGLRVISASADRTLKVWDLESGRALVTLEGHAGPVNACAVTADGAWVVSASADRSLKIWEPATGRCLATLIGHAGSVNACAVTAGKVVSASDDGTLKIWDMELEGALGPVYGHAGRINACAVTEDGRHAVSASSDRTVKIWDVDTGHSLSTLPEHPDAVTACAVTADGRRVVSAAIDQPVTIWDLGRGSVLATLEGHADVVNACVVTCDGRRVVSASSDRTLRIWDLNSGAALATLEGHAHWVLACAVTADGRRVISGSADRTLRLWDLESGRALAALDGHADWVFGCAVTPDGRRTISASADGTLKVWDLESAGLLATLAGHAASVNACAVAADGRHVISASADRTLKVWDLDTGACLFTHRGDAPYVAVVAAPDAIVAGDIAGTIWTLDWPARKAAEPARAGHGDDVRHGPAPVELRPPGTPIRKHTILFLTANPIESDELALGREARAIQLELERSGCRDRFEFVTRWATEPIDLLRELRKLKPTVVHFSGHGGSRARERLPGHLGHRGIVGPGAPHGLYFQGLDGRAQLVSAAALRETFGAAGASVRLVVLSACHSEVQAEGLLAHVDCVVGIAGPIHDDAARSFAIGFYGGLGECESAATAYKQGLAAISLEGLHDGEPPRLLVRQGIDANRIVLAAELP